MGDLPSPLTFSALSEPSADVSREYRRDGAEDWQTPESVLDALRQPRDPSKSGVAAELAAVSVRPHVRASSTISLADVNAAIAKNAVQTGEVNVPRDFGPAREQIVHEATPLRQGPDHWVSFVKSAREVGPGDVLEVVTRGDRPARLAAVVDHVVSAVRDESGWTSEVAHRLVHTGELSELLSKYPAAGTNSCVRLELRARTFKLPTAAFREAKLGASLLAYNMHYVTKNRMQDECRGRVSQIDPTDRTSEAVPCRAATLTMFDGTKVRIEVRSTAGSWHGVLRSDEQALMQAVLVELDNGHRIKDCYTSKSLSMKGKSTRRGCERCCYTGVLAGFGLGKSVDANDRACECSPMKSEGPSEWTAVVGRERLVEGSTQGWSTMYESVTVRKGEQRLDFIVAEYSEGLGRSVGTAIARVRDEPITAAEIRRQWDEGEALHTLAVHGESCRDMAVARLLIALREGSVKPC